LNKINREKFGQIIGNRLRITRCQHGLSQTDLQNITGIDRATLSRIENGQQQISLFQLLQVLKALQVKPELFLKELKSTMKTTIELDDGFPSRYIKQNTQHYMLFSRRNNYRWEKFVINDKIFFRKQKDGNIKPCVMNSASYISKLFQKKLIWL
jgi:transcriptional regulator with XRE-family HTH domain